MALPTVVGLGTFDNGNNAITPTLPTGFAADDILLLILESAAGENYSTPSGWAAVTGSPVSTAETVLTVLWRRAQAGDTAPTIADSGNHNFGIIIGIRGAITSGDPWDIVVTSTDGVPTTSATFPGGTTTVADCLVVMTMAAGLPDAGANNNLSGESSPLANLVTQFERTIATGDGGGIAIVTGQKASAGSFAATTGTWTATTNKAYLTIAIKPPSVTTVSSSFTANAVLKATIGVALEDRFTRTTSADDWGKSTYPNATYHFSGESSHDFSVNGSAGVVVLNVEATSGTAGTYRDAQDVNDTPIRVLNQEIYGRFQFSDSPVSADLNIQILARSISTDLRYRFEADIQPDDSTAISIKLENAGATTLAGGTNIGTLSPDTWYWMRARVTGTDPTALSMMIWADGAVPPNDWMLSTSHTPPSGIQVGGGIGIRNFVGTGATALPLSVLWDDLQLYDLAQSFTADAVIALNVATSFNANAFVQPFFTANAIVCRVVMNDTFTRSTSDPELGVSPEGFVWQNTPFENGGEQLDGQVHVNGSHVVVGAGNEVAFVGAPIIVKGTVQFDFYVPVNEGDWGGYIIDGPAEITGAGPLTFFALSTHVFPNDGLTITAPGDPAFSYIFPSGTFTSGVWWTIKTYYDVVGETSRAKAWVRGEPEPDWLTSAAVVEIVGLNPDPGYMGGYPRLHIESSPAGVENLGIDNLIIKSFSNDPWLVVHHITLNAELAAVSGLGFTADAILRVPRSVNLTADAVIRTSVSASFTADAASRKTVSELLTADGVILAATSASVTANAVIRSTTEQAYAADAIILVSALGTITGDAVLKGASSASLSAEAILLSVSEASRLADAVVLAPASATFVADSIISASIAASFRADATFLASSAASAPADAVLRASSTGSFSADAVLVTSVSDTIVTDAVLLTISAVSCTSDAVLHVLTTGSVSADAILIASIYDGFSANAIVLSSQEETLATNAIILTPIAVSFSTDAFVQPWFSADAYLVGAFSADSIMLLTATASVGLDAWVQGSGVSAFTADAILAQTSEKILAADAVLLATPSATLFADAVLLEVRTASLTAQAVVQAFAVATITADAVQLKTTEDTLSAVGVILTSRMVGFSADAIFVSEVSSSFASDAIVLASPEFGVTTDGIVLRSASGTFTADASFTTEAALSFFANAIIEAELVGSWTADAAIQRSQSAAFLADAAIQRGSEATLTADAVINATRVGSFGADAVLGSPEATQGSFEAEAILERMAEGGITADAIQFSTSVNSFASDAITRDVEQASLATDAIVRAAPSASLAADAVLHATTQGAISADAQVLVTRPATVTASASLVRTTSAFITAESYVQPYFTANAVILIQLTGRFVADVSATTHGATLSATTHGVTLQADTHGATVE